MAHTPTHSAFGPVLGHRTRPWIRFFNAPDDGGDSGGTPAADTSTGGSSSDTDQLGDAGKQAIDRMKAERNTARAEAAAFKALGLTVEQIKALQTAPAGADEDTVRETAARQAEAAATARFEAQARRTAVREQARALGFHNATDALAEISSDELAKVSVADDEADEAAVKALVKAVAEKKPYLVKQPGSTHQDAGIGGAGSHDKPEVRPGLDRIRNAYAATTK